jgi:hypothetical protein
MSRSAPTGRGADLGPVATATPATVATPYNPPANVVGVLAFLVGIARELQARGVRTPAGHDQWQPVQVSRLLAV